MTPRLKLTKARRRAAVQSYAHCGSFARACEHMGIHVSTLWRWRRDNPDFEAELREAGEEYNVRVGHLARSTLEQHLEAARSAIPADGVVRSRRQAVTKEGEVVWLETEEAYQLSPALVRIALTKLDPAWTHPKEQIEHSGGFDLEAVIAKTEKIRDRHREEERKNPPRPYKEVLAEQAGGIRRVVPLHQQEG